MNAYRAYRAHVAEAERYYTDSGGRTSPRLDKEGQAAWDAMPLWRRLWICRTNWPDLVGEIAVCVGWVTFTVSAWVAGH